MWQFEKTQMS